MAVLHQDPSLLAVGIRAPLSALNALVLNALIEGDPSCEGWWKETTQVALRLPQHAEKLVLC